ncbi:MAG: hypothetical protein ACLUTU_00715 [Blautia faecis]
MKKKYITGDVLKEYGFTIVIVKSYSSCQDDLNLEAMNFVQAFMDWLDQQNDSKDFPDFGKNARSKRWRISRTCPICRGEPGRDNGKIHDTGKSYLQRKEKENMKLEREALAHFLDTSWGSDPAKAAWEILGEDIDDMSVDLNPDTETKENILGKTKVTDKGYQPSMSADPFYADPASKLYPKIREIAMGRLKGDACKTLMLEVIVEDTEAVKHLAYAREVLVKPQSYGGGTEGVNFPFNVHENGARTKGYVTAESLKTGNPVFEAGEITG